MKMHQLKLDFKFWKDNFSIITFSNLLFILKAETSIEPNDGHKTSGDILLLMIIYQNSDFNLVSYFLRTLRNKKRLPPRSYCVQNLVQNHRNTVHGHDPCSCGFPCLSKIWFFKSIVIHQPCTSKRFIPTDGGGNHNFFINFRFNSFFNESNFLEMGGSVTKICHRIGQNVFIIYFCKVILNSGKLS